MRDSFAAEFPSFAAALGRLSRPTIAREPWLWAALSGLGAGAIAAAVLQLPLIALRVANLRDPAAWAASVAAILATAIGVGVAWRAGRSRAVLLYVGIRLAYSLAALPGVVLFCDRSGETNCFFRFAIGQWTIAAGVLVAVAAMTLLRSGPVGRNATVSATGAYTAAHQLFSVPLAVLAFDARVPTDPFAQVAYISIAAVAAAAIGGAVLGLRGGTWAGALVAIAVIATNWGLEIWPLIAFEQRPSWTLLSMVTGPAQVIALIGARALVRPARDESS